MMVQPRGGGRSDGRGGAGHFCLHQNPSFIRYTMQLFLGFVIYASNQEFLLVSIVLTDFWIQMHFLWLARLLPSSPNSAMALYSNNGRGGVVFE